MSWGAILALAAGCYAFKAAGPVLLRDRPVPYVLEHALSLLAIPLLAALIAVQTFGHGNELVLDARAAGLGVAAVAAMLRAPFLVVMLSACATAALLRLL
jgi:branched-subunit amino acid transport protein